MKPFNANLISNLKALWKWFGNSYDP
jgi:hypothetical protein